MSVYWNEWECPICRRIGAMDPQAQWKPGDIVEMECPACGNIVSVEACESLEFVAYRPENAPEPAGCEFCDGMSNPQEQGDMDAGRLLACIRGHTMVLRALDLAHVPQWLVAVEYCPKCGRKL